MKLLKPASVRMNAPSCTSASAVLLFWPVSASPMLLLLLQETLLLCLAEREERACEIAGIGSCDCKRAQTDCADPTGTAAVMLDLASLLHAV